MAAAFSACSARWRHEFMIRTLSVDDHLAASQGNGSSRQRRIRYGAVRRSNQVRSCAAFANAPKLWLKISASGANSVVGTGVEWTVPASVTYSTYAVPCRSLLLRKYLRRKT